MQLRLVVMSGLFFRGGGDTTGSPSSCSPGRACGPSFVCVHVARSFSIAFACSIAQLCTRSLAQRCHLAQLCARNLAQLCTCSLAQRCSWHMALHSSVHVQHCTRMQSCTALCTQPCAALCTCPYTAVHTHPFTDRARLHTSTPSCTRTRGRARPCTRKRPACNLPCRRKGNPAARGMPYSRSFLFEGGDEFGAASVPIAPSPRPPRPPRPARTAAARSGAGSTGRALRHAAAPARSSVSPPAAASFPRGVPPPWGR